MALRAIENVDVDTEAKSALVEQFRVENIAVAHTILTNVASGESPLRGLDSLDYQIRDKDGKEVPETYTLAVDGIGRQLEATQERRVTKQSGEHKR
jgi:hypothetical protein